MIFNMTGGGSSGGEPESTILVTAPAGSSVTASLNGVTKTAGEVNGLWTFPGCGLGLWTLHARSADQTQETQVTVDIQEESQRMRYYVTITYFAATIQVTYPAGSACTCANGETVLSAPDTSGTAAFVLPWPGDWVVSCSNGLSGEEYREKSKTVSITEAGQQESIELLYRLIVFGEGVIPAFLKYNPYAKYAVEDNVLTASITKNQKYALTTESTFDLTKYDTLKILVKGHMDVGISDVYKSSFDNRVAATDGGGTDDAFIEKALDISSFSGAYYIGLFRWTSSVETSYVSRIWLE